MKRRPITVASNVLLSDEGLLLGLRSDSLLWGLPGGKVEAESVFDAGRREQKEENGMALLGSPVPVGFADSWEHEGARGRKWHVCHFLVWRLWAGKPARTEESHMRWEFFKLDKLPPLKEMTYATRFFVENYLGLVAATLKGREQEKAQGR